MVVPAKTDIKLVDWAMRAKFQDLIEHGIKIYTGPKPFDHSKLMVVDDDPEVRVIVAEFLEDFGYSVLQARSGAEALELLASAL